MATEEQKKINKLRLTQIVLTGLASGIWDILGEGAMGLTHQIGAGILPVMEKEMGLEIVGETPADVLQEIGRLMVDEFGFAQNVEVIDNGDTLDMKISKCINAGLTGEMKKAGVGKPSFICPYMALSDAALDKMGTKAISQMQKNEKTEVITFELI